MPPVCSQSLWSGLGLLAEPNPQEILGPFQGWGDLWPAAGGEAQWCEAQLEMELVMAGTLWSLLGTLPSRQQQGGLLWDTEQPAERPAHLSGRRRTSSCHTLSSVARLWEGEAEDPTRNPQHFNPPIFTTHPGENPGLCLLSFHLIPSMSP